MTEWNIIKILSTIGGLFTLVSILAYWTLQQTFQAYLLVFLILFVGILVLSDDPTFKKEKILEADDGCIITTNDNQIVTDFDTDKEVWIKLIGKSQRTKRGN